MEITKKEVDFRKKAFTPDGWILTFDDVLCLPGYTDFSPNDCNISSRLGPYKFKTPIITAAMDTVTETEMAKAMALYGTMVFALYVDPVSFLIFLKSRTSRHRME